MVRLELKLKKILLGVVLLGAASTAALAADLPSRRAPPVYYPPAVPVPVFTWSGLYAGVNAGYAFDGHQNFSNSGRGVAAGTYPAYVRSSTDGFTGGAQIGYNYELGQTGLPLLGGIGGVGSGVVIGVEADAAYTDLRQNLLVGTRGFSANTQYVGTARGRIGYAFGNFLIFGTGGFAYGGVKDSITGADGYASTNTIRTGYTYGGGLEYAIPTTSFVNVFHSSAVTLKAEYLHYDLGTQNLAIGTRGGVSSIHTDGNIVRAGINYKFDLLGSPAAPVVARY